MTIETYIDELRAKKLSKNTIRHYSFVLKRLNEFKNLDEITKTDLITFFNQLEGKENTVRTYQADIKKYFNDMGKPEIVSWITKKTAKETLKSDDILTSDDINKMIDSTENHYWKALIAFLFETGCRIGEAKSLKFKDFVETSDGMIINIPTHKTNAGYRKTILPFSGQYIRNLKTYINAKSDDIVFTKAYSRTWVTLDEIAKDAGITKSVSPHKFRHAQATSMVKLGYNEAIIRKKLGWSPTSAMIARYQHLNDDDVINATLSNTGKIPKTAVRIEMKEAEKLTLVDAASQFSKLNSENELLKSKIELLEQKEAEREKAELEEQKHIDEQIALKEAQEEEAEKAKSKEEKDKEKALFAAFQEFMKQSKNFPIQI